jgi:uncharacterized membrane protein YjjB (DUF3815 family)
MRNLFLAILGAIFAWGIYSFFTKTFDETSLFSFIIAIVVGYYAGKREK